MTTAVQNPRSGLTDILAPVRRHLVVLAATVAVAAPVACRVNSTPSELFRRVDFVLVPQASGGSRKISGNGSNGAGWEHVRNASIGWTARARLRPRGLQIVLVDLSSDAHYEVSLHSVAALSACYIQKLAFVRGGNLLLEADINPSLTLMVLTNPTSRRGCIFLGAGFQLSPEGSRVAYFRYPPHFAVPCAHSAAIMVGKRKLAEIRFSPKWGWPIARWTGERALVVTWHTPSGAVSSEGFLYHHGAFTAAQ